MRASASLPALLLALPALLLALLLSPIASAGPVDQAEVQRLSIELRDRVAESQWQAADDKYARLVQVSGAKPSYEDHWRGYLAAQALGDAIAQAQRLAAASKVERTSEVSVAEAALMAWYGRVDIKIAGGKQADEGQEALALTMLEVPFESDQRRVFEAASTALTERGRYSGLLPLGMYQLGETHFEILGEDEPVKVRVKR